MFKARRLFFILILISLAHPAYGFKIDGFDLKNALTFYHNDENSPNRLDYFGAWKYKDKAFLKIIYRGDYTSNFHDTTFSQLMPTAGIYFYKNLAIVYQHERRRYHTVKNIYSDEEDRYGVSFELTNQLFNKKLLLYNDLQLFPFETKSDQRIRLFSKLGYKKLFLSNIFYIDHDHSKAYNGVEFMYFLQATLGYSIYKNKFIDVSLRYQFQDQKKRQKVYRFGMGADF